MRNDVASNFTIAEAVAAANTAVGTVNGASVDHATGSSVSFFISVGNVEASSTIDMKTQYSEDNSAWTDYPAADEAGNDDTITQLIAAGSAVLHVPNPRARYSRVVVDVSLAASDLSVVSVLGPLRHISA